MKIKFAKTYYFFVMIITLLLFFANACSTKKNTFVTRTYHNITAYYNVYFNGKEAFKSGLKKIDEAHKDNYSVLLPIFKYSNSETARAAFSDMNRAIEKAGKCIRKHSITAKPKKKKKKKKKKKEQTEYVKWIDDSYLLIGQANFYKKDFFPAIETFNYLIKQYNNEPIKYDAYLWLSRCYVEMEKYPKAKEFLSAVDNDKKDMPERLIADFQLTWADLMLKEKKYIETIPYLEKAITFTKNKKDKARYVYILAQIYELLEDDKKAGENYEKVIALNPPYEMSFNARINHASVFNSAKNGSKNLVKQLKKMLKDDKNIDYRDQIYYALGNIAYKEGRENEAIEMFLLSAKSSTQNENQKAISYLALANIYFEEPIYEKAQMYYDSTMSFLDQNYPNYLKIKRKSENLNELIVNISQVHLQDSLLKIAAKPPSEQIQIVDKIIANLIKKEEEQKQAEAQQQKDLAYLQQSNYEMKQQSGKWYFYNPAMMSSGSMEFKKKWGDRKLEDNWRRKNKQEMASDFIAEEKTEQQDSTKPVYSKKSREYYLQNLPLGDSAKLATNKKIEKAMFQIASLYKDKFYDYPLSIQSYKDLMLRFPNTKYKLSSYYDLYKIHLFLKNQQKAEKYKNKILQEFPESDYAKVLKDPEYFIQLEANQNKIKFLYQATYRYFLVGNCEEVRSNFYYADSIYPQSKLIAKFDLLKTLCLGENKDSAIFKQELNEFVARRKGTEEEKYAKEVLAALNRKPREVELKNTQEKEKIIDEFTQQNDQSDSIDYSMYTFDKNSEHAYIVIVANEKTDPTRIHFNLSDFNIDYYNFLNFEISKIILSAKYTAIVVNKFKNSKMAANYFESVFIAGEVFQNIDKKNFRTYTISKENLQTFSNDKNVFRYQKFFEEFYPKLEKIKPK